MSQLGKRGTGAIVLKQVPAKRRRLGMRGAVLPAKKLFVSTYKTPYPVTMRSPGFPRTKIVRMQYCESVSNLTSTSGVLSGHAFSANSIYDPNASGTGHQASGHDQWANFYKQYIVLSSRIRVYVVPSASQTVPSITSVHVSSSSAPVAAKQTTIIENGGAFRVMNASTALSTQMMSYSFNAAKFFNCNPKDNDLLRAYFSANPGSRTYYHVALQGQDESTTCAVDVTVLIDYVVSLSDPVDLAES